MGGANIESGTSIAVDLSGNVYTTGYFEGTADFGTGTDVFNLIAAGRSDIFVTKYGQTATAAKSSRQPGAPTFICSGSSSLLRYTIPGHCFVRVSYYDLKGRLTVSLVNAVQGPGSYSLVQPVSRLSNGAYLRVFEAGMYVKSEIIMAAQK